MQLRVATDQPWDVRADVLAIPIVGDPAFDGPLGELNRRTGGELASLAAFGELRGKRFTSAVVVRLPKWRANAPCRIRTMLLASDSSSAPGPLRAM